MSDKKIAEVLQEAEAVFGVYTCLSGHSHCLLGKLDKEEADTLAGAINVNIAVSTAIRDERIKRKEAEILAAKAARLAEETKECEEVAAADVVDALEMSNGKFGVYVRKNYLSNGCLVDGLTTSEAETVVRQIDGVVGEAKYFRDKRIKQQEEAARLAAVKDEQEMMARFLAGKNPLKTVEAHNAWVREQRNETTKRDRKTGVACPNCGGELEWCDVYGGYSRGYAKCPNPGCKSFPTPVLERMP